MACGEHSALASHSQSCYNCFSAGRAEEGRGNAGGEESEVKKTI